MAEVKSGGCDLGIAFDGDGDRIGAIDGKGRILWGDQLMVLWARDVLKTHPGATIIADVKASQVLFDEIARAGGKPMMFKTGHSLIKSKMAEIGAPLAGEMSGHVFFADTLLRLRRRALLRRCGCSTSWPTPRQSLADMRDGLPQPVNTPELRFDCPDERKFAVVEEVKARLQKAGAKFSDIDGVRVSTKDGWWLLRASNTQPVLVARCEAADQAGLERLMAELKAALAGKRRRACPTRPPPAPLMLDGHCPCASSSTARCSIATSWRWSSADGCRRGVRAGELARPRAATRQGSELSDRACAIRAARSTAPWSAG